MMAKTSTASCAKDGSTPEGHWKIIVATQLVMSGVNDVSVFFAQSMRRPNMRILPQVTTSAVGVITGQISLMRGLLIITARIVTACVGFARNFSRMTITSGWLVTFFVAFPPR